MADQARIIWLHVAPGVESLAHGRQVWTQPAAVRKALGELLSVCPATHVQIDLSALVAAGQEAANWPAFLKREAAWSELLPELTLAISDAVTPRTWGLGLPTLPLLAAALGDTSERGLLKAGMQAAAFLQNFRQSSVGFVTLDWPQDVDAGRGRCAAPIFRNSHMYGWQRAVSLADPSGLAHAPQEVDLRLIKDFSLAEVQPLWTQGERVGGGLTKAFWTTPQLPSFAPSSYVLYGNIPEDITPQQLVEAGRTLHTWLT
ncbi:MAG: hypothetical protein O7G88_15840 [bacterium]|nr:hypothetical protein [bacterium]